MDERKFMPLQKISAIYGVSISVILSMDEYELIEISNIENTGYIEVDELGKFERFLRLYNDLGINIEGLCVINELLQERENLKQEIIRLQNRYI